MSKKVLPRIKILPEDRKKLPIFRSVQKHKNPVLDPRRGSRIAADAVTALVTDRLKLPRDLDLISNALNSHFIFTSLSSENRSVVISQMKHYSMLGKEVVFEQGCPGNLFFVVCTGKLEVTVNSKRVNILGPGDSFGELALLHDSPRSASVATLEKVSMWGLDRKSFRMAVESVNAQNYKENQHFIESVPLFSILTNMQKDSLVGSLSTLKFRPNDVIVNEGDPGDLFYIIKEGTVNCVKKGQKIREMGKGEFFGEQALLYNTQRTATVIAITEVKCVAVSRNKLTIALGNNLENVIYENSKIIAFEKSPNLKLVSKVQQLKMMKKMKVICYRDGNVVINPGMLKRDKLIIVLLGSLKVGSRTVAEVFQCIGDLEFLIGNESIHDCEILAYGETHVAELKREDFIECMDTNVKPFIMNREAITALKQVNIFKSLPSDKFHMLTQILKQQKFENKDVIIREYAQGDSFYLIKSGKVDIVQNGVILRTVTKNDYFGERSLVLNEYRSASVIANGPVTCWFLTKSDFQSILEDNLLHRLQERIEMQDYSINLSDLIPIKLLGRGNFGTVFLVLSQKTNRLFALKSILRQKIEKYSMQENLIQEHKILQTLDHEMILKLVKSFKDSKRIYFLTEHVKGCDLFDALREMNSLNDREGKFFIGCLLLILEYLHERDIIYRDLKPENVMIDQDGYPKLIDFGISKLLTGRTYTIVGTPHYMAPEVILGKGYTLLADYWSLGIMLYEFFCFTVPFGDDIEEPYEVYQKVLERKLEYPSFVDLKLPAKAIIEILLSKNPNSRNLGGIEALKGHAWFQGLNWESLINKQITAPFKPSLPDLDNEIRRAVINRVPLEEFIDRNEEVDKDEAACRRPRNVPTNWDKEF